MPVRMLMSLGPRTGKKPPLFLAGFLQRISAPKEARGARCMLLRKLCSLRHTWDTRKT